MASQNKYHCFAEMLRRAICDRMLCDYKFMREANGLDASAWAKVFRARVS
jgi:hypothetical protein